MSDMATAKRDRRRIPGADQFPKECRATNRQGQPCRRPTMIGATVCAPHGGRAPQVRAAADRRVAEAAAAIRARAMLDAMLLNLDAEPIHDPGALVMRMAARAESGFAEAAARIEVALTAGISPADTDVELFKFFGGMATKLGLDMTRLQIGASLAAHYVGGTQGDVQGELDTSGAPALPAAPVVPLEGVIASVLAAEHQLETDRLVRLKAVEVASSAELRVIEGEAESA